MPLKFNDRVQPVVVIILTFTSHEFRPCLIDYKGKFDQTLRKELKMSQKQ